ncbi:glutamate receptor 2.8-like [Salvia hispanica]|uniref:glutamate receptor 2.8-like n=1 Tax=Salvia hispanica TaxID=49212 RepID=UPI0020099EA9|nr:glutamate receptor 2.8-like [Salvia hispanica]
MFSRRKLRRLLRSDSHSQRFLHNVSQEFLIHIVLKRPDFLLYEAQLAHLITIGEKVRRNLTRFVVITWVFEVPVLTTSYTANLASMLTVEQLQCNINYNDDLIKNGEFVGYQTGSFVGEFMKNNGILESSHLKDHSTRDQFHEALSKGSKREE